MELSPVPPMSARNARGRLGGNLEQDHSSITTEQNIPKPQSTRQARNLPFRQNDRKRSNLGALLSKLVPPDTPFPLHTTLTILLTTLCLTLLLLPTLFYLVSLTKSLNPRIGRSTCDHRLAILNTRSMDIVSIQYFPAEDGELEIGKWNTRIPLARLFFGRGIYNINFVFGDFDFEVVKLIDVLWDAVVGRGGQALLVAMASPIFMRITLALFDGNAVGVGVFVEIFLRGVVEGQSLWALLKEAFQSDDDSGSLSGAPRKRKSVSRKGWCFGLALLTAWPIVFPTLINATTGYVALTEQMVRLESGMLMPYTMFSSKFYADDAYYVKDGERIGLGEDAWVYRAENKKLYNELRQYWLYRERLETAARHPEMPVSTLNQIFSASRLTAFRHLPDPEPEPLPFSSLDPPLTLTERAFVLNGTVYTEDAFDAGSPPVTCVGSDRYGFGFSAAGTLVVVLGHAAWCLGLYAMWWRAGTVSKVARSEGAGMDVWRASCEVAGVVREACERTEEGGEDEARDLGRTMKVQRVGFVVDSREGRRGRVRLRTVGF